ncbi:hypothetical protein N7536_010194 [Penicillium majusculum]|uniref:Uncharacterized protein n=1 Tax=Penicillium solitum TaxID=60172 RepID=A0A1V6QXQ9_9EURO|nr:uncharacterized protein PENSOL_c030G06333 [Penicillium solitum]KAJ5687575.1 hypothetical protein N7536_010194 [Penicillium majusculum]OQD93786.1 hypothetical protein PENSOL_c030G06333 [Penicillium solitum]
MTASVEVIERNAAIKARLSQVTDLIEELCNLSTAQSQDPTLEENGQRNQTHRAVVEEVWKLLYTIRGPVDSIFSHFENAAHTGALRALMEIGVFTALPQDGSSKTADSLAQECSVDKDLLVRLLRITTIWGPFKEDDIETYSHTPYSLVYLIPGLQSTFKLMADEGHPVWVQWSKFFQANRWVNPVDNVKSPWSFIHGTGNKTAWEYLALFPERFQAFNDAMQAQTSATAWTVELYPFAQALAEVPSSADTPLVVDIGGGKGLALQRIRELVGKDVTGRFILQDLQIVLDDATTEEVVGLEVQAVDFFQPQPVKGATVYYVRRVLHDWSDEVCVKILQNIAMAITDKISQRVVIAENIIPSKNTGVEAAWQDMTMMALGGTERTLKQWETVLGQAGFQLHRTFIAPGTNYASIEAFLI